MVDGGYGLVVGIDVTANHAHHSPTEVSTVVLAHQRIDLTKVIPRWRLVEVGESWWELVGVGGS